MPLGAGLCSWLSSYWSTARSRSIAAAGGERLVGSAISIDAHDVTALESLLQRGRIQVSSF